MSNRRQLRIGLLQLQGHPALLMGGLDLLREPFPYDASLRIDALSAHFQVLRTCQNGIKGEYLRWVTERLGSILKVIAGWGAPDVLLLPECLVPLEALETVREYARTSGTTVLAGTHSRPQTADADRRYAALGVSGSALTALSANTPGVLPIFLADNTSLREKLVPSPFELSEVDLPEEDLPTLPTVRDSRRGVDIGPLICAEALRRPHFDKRPTLVTIVAHDQNPSQFGPHIETFVQTKHVVAMANDARFGGSGVFVLRDKRPIGWWWFDTPISGRLPVGESYLEVNVNLDAPAPQQGTTAPSQSVSLVRLASIHGHDDPVAALEPRALEAARDRNGLLLHAICKEIEAVGGSPVTSLRWRRVLQLVESGSASPAWLSVLGEHIRTDGIDTLATLERASACRVHRELQKLVNDPAVQSASREVAGDLLLRNQKYSALCNQGLSGTPSGSPPPRTDAPIGRNELIRQLRQDLGGQTRPIITVAGTAGIGKSTVLNAAFAQSGLSPLFVDCPEGSSPDYLYEYMLRAAGYVPSGRAPRPSFEVDELKQALVGHRAVWFSNAQNLIDSGQWLVESFEALFESLSEAFRSSSDLVAIVFETARDLPLPTVPGVPMLRRRVPALPAPEGVDLLRLRMRQARVPDETATDEQRANLVKLLDGHPYLIGLAADAVAKASVEDVIRDIQGRGNLYRSMASALVGRLRLSQHEKSCLAALTRCRAPVPTSLLQYVLPPEQLKAALEGLSGTSLISRTENEGLEVSYFLRNTSLSTLALERHVAMRFHDAASRYFTRVARGASGSQYLTLANEANYHAAAAEKKPPFEIQGIRDGLVGAARQHYKRDEFDLVIQLLEPIASGQGPVADDVLTILAEAYAWSNRTADSLRLAKQLVSKNPRYLWLVVAAGDAALSSRRLPDAEKALREAESLGAHDYRFHLLRGKIRERQRDPLGALSDYEDACAKAVRDAWPFFFLSRSLRKVGRPKEALTAIDRAREYINETSGLRVGDRLEAALLSEEMYCLVLTGDMEMAASMARGLMDDPNASTEAIVSAAYVEAAASEPFNEENALKVYDRALTRLAEKDSEKAHARATIALMRGHLLERVGSAARAETEYAKASELDPYNAHMKECQLRLLLARMRKSQRSGQEGAARLQAREALALAQKLLRVSPGNDAAKECQRDIFEDFGLQ